MSHEIVAAQPTNQTGWDNDIAALALQLEEIDRYDGEEKGKCREDNLSDNGRALEAFQSQVQAHMGFLNDQMLAHSIANSDLQASAGLSSEDMDLDFEASSSNDIGYRVLSEDQVIALVSGAPDPHSEPEDIDQGRSLFQICNIFDDNELLVPGDEEAEAGPSGTCVKRQISKPEIPSQAKQLCRVCFEYSRPSEIVELECEHVWCTGCLRSDFLQAIENQAFFPPKCCQRVPLSLAATHLSGNEIEDFELAEIEFLTKDKTYCSKANCGKFIPPTCIKAEKADCKRCNSATCTMCKNVFHEDECPADALLEATLALADDQEWQRCYSCGALVDLTDGCYHMK